MSPLCHVFALLFLASGLASAQYTRINVAIGPGDSPGTLHLYLSDSRRTTFKIIDQGAAARDAYKNLGAAMQAHMCQAGCNGGPADKQGNPLGLVIADGKTFGRPTPESDLTAGILFMDGSQPRIKRAAAFFANGAATPRHLLQTGPFLVEDGKVVADLDAKRIARRTFVLTDGDNRWAIGVAPATTLQQLALALADPKTFKEFDITTSLCLDGASSSGIWVTGEHGPLYLKEIRKLRNFIGLVRR